MNSVGERGGSHRKPSVGQNSGAICKLRTKKRESGDSGGEGAQKNPNAGGRGGAFCPRKKSYFARITEKKTSGRKCWGKEAIGKKESKRKEDVTRLREERPQREEG